MGDERAQEPSSSLRESLIKFLFLLIFSTPPWRAGENTELTSKHPQTAATMSPAPSSSSMARSARRSLSSSATCARSWNPTPPVVSRQAASFRTFFSSTSLTTRPGAHKEQAYRLPDYRACSQCFAPPCLHTHARRAHLALDPTPCWSYAHFPR